MVKSKWYERTFYALLAVGLFLLAWHCVTTYTAVRQTTPPPLEVLRYLKESFVKPLGPFTLIGHTLISIRRVLIGFAVGSAAGILCGIAMGTVPTFRSLFRPFFEVFRQIPPIAWIPMSILWFGLGELPKIFIIFIGSFVNVTLNTYEGATHVDPTLIGAARMLGSSPRDLFTHIILPACVPSIFNGMQVGFSVSWMGVLAAELVSSYAGIGWIIIRGSDTANIPQVMTGMIVIGLVGLILSTLMRAIERRLTQWNQTGI